MKFDTAFSTSWHWPEKLENLSIKVRSLGKIKAGRVEAGERTCQVATLFISTRFSID